jgi:hypothetical protein
MEEKATRHAEKVQSAKMQLAARLTAERSIAQQDAAILAERQTRESAARKSRMKIINDKRKARDAARVAAKVQGPSGSEEKAKNNVATKASDRNKIKAVVTVDDQRKKKQATLRAEARRANAELLAPKLSTSVAAVTASKIPASEVVSSFEDTFASNISVATEVAIIGDVGDSFDNGNDNEIEGMNMAVILGSFGSVDDFGDDMEDLFGENDIQAPVDTMTTQEEPIVQDEATSTPTPTADQVAPVMTNFMAAETSTSLTLSPTAGNLPKNHLIRTAKLGALTLPTATKPTTHTSYPTTESIFNKGMQIEEALPQNEEEVRTAHHAQAAANRTVSVDKIRLERSDKKAEVEALKIAAEEKNRMPENVRLQLATYEAQMAQGVKGILQKYVTLKAQWSPQSRSQSSQKAMQALNEIKEKRALELPPKSAKRSSKSKATTAISSPATSATKVLAKRAAENSIEGPRKRRQVWNPHINEWMDGGPQGTPISLTPNTRGRKPRSKIVVPSALQR